MTKENEETESGGSTQTVVDPKMGATIQAVVDPPSRQADMVEIMMDLASSLNGLDVRLGRQNSDPTYNQKMDKIAKLRKEDFLESAQAFKENIVSESVEKSIIQDPKRDKERIQAPKKYGNRKMTEKEIKKFYAMLPKPGSGGSDKTPKIESVFRMKLRMHEELNYEISQDEWSHVLLNAVAPSMYSTMEHYASNNIPASIYFPVMLNTFRSENTRSTAKQKLFNLTSDLNQDVVVVLKKIGEISRDLEPDPQKYHEMVMDEAERYVSAYAGTAKAVLLRNNYFGKGPGLQNYINYCLCAEEFKSELEAGRRKLLEEAHKNTRNVNVNDNSSASFVTNHQVAVDTCFNCGRSGHRSRECKEPRKGMKCYICAGEHKQADCPKKQQVSSNLGARPKQGKCEIHPQATHSNQECRQQKNNTCHLHPNGKHSNSECTQQKQCDVGPNHHTHLKKDCFTRKFGGNNSQQGQRFRPQGQQFTPNQQWNRPQNQQWPRQQNQQWTRPPQQWNGFQQNPAGQTQRPQFTTQNPPPCSNMGPQVHRTEVQGDLAQNLATFLRDNGFQA